MFRRLPSALPPDPTFPKDFKKLGYFITDDDLIRSIDYPTETFMFKVNRNSRYNDVHCEAMHMCIREEVFNRCQSNGLRPLYLPQLSTTKPDNDKQHIMILTTPQEKLKTKKRVIVVVNGVLEDLGIWSYRAICSNGGINGGSCLSLAKKIVERAKDMPEDESPGLIIMNPGQLVYSYRAGRTMTLKSWENVPRPSGVHPSAKIHPELNYVPQNKTAEDHINFVFEKILLDPAFVAETAELNLVGLGSGGDGLLSCLDSRWNIYSSRIAALALTNPYPFTIVNADFKDFLDSRARSWILFHHADGTYLGRQGGGYHREYFCHTFSAGPDIKSREDIFPLQYENILDWFKEVAQGIVGYDGEVSEKIKKEFEWDDAKQEWG